MCISLGAAVLISAVMGAGASMYAASQQPDAMEQPQIKDGVEMDKSVAQESEQLDEAVIGDEESDKRRKKSSKEKFKIPQLETESGVNLGEGESKPTGVQI